MHPRPIARSAALLLAAALAAAPLPAQGKKADAALAAYVPAARHGEWPQDAGHALYLQGREALNRQDWQRAARTFQQVRQRHPRSQYVADALYWEAFARYRMGGLEQLRAALGGLETQLRQHARAGTRDEARELAARIRGELARHGDARAADRVREDARTATQECERAEDDERVAALNALLTMDSEQAMPILRRVLARRDACSEKLRVHALFLVSRKRPADWEELLLGVSRNDPAPQVRRQALFWVAQSGTDRSMELIEEVLRTSRDPEMQEQALFALSRHDSPRAAAALRRYAERSDVPDRVREQAVFWIGQKGSPENAEYLRGLFRRTGDAKLKEQILHGLSRIRGNERWLMEVAMDAQQPADVRKQAIFWAGRNGMTSAEIARLYDQMRDAEMRRQLVFLLGQRVGGEREDRVALDKLIEIVRRREDPEMRQAALHWLGRSKDPRASQLLMEIIDQ